MRVLTDEHVSPVVTNTLRSEGVDGVSVYDTRAAGADDTTVLEVAIENESAVLTNDRDFVTEEFVEATSHWGILFYEDQRTPRNDIVRAVHNALSVLRPAKIAENSTDYSFNNTVRNMLWLPTTKAMKYQAKQAVAVAELARHAE